MSVNSETSIAIDRALKKIGVWMEGVGAKFLDLGRELVKRLGINSTKVNSFSEATEVVWPILKSLGVAYVANVATVYIGTLAFALTTKVLLCLCVIAIALYLVIKIFKIDIDRSFLDEKVFDKIREFSGSGLNYSEFRVGVRALASRKAIIA